MNHGIAKKVALVMPLLCIGWQPDCKDQDNCMLCAASRAQSGLGSCRWCSLQNKCHEPGSWYDLCRRTPSKTITEVNKCPASSTGPLNYKEEIAKVMSAYSGAAYCPPPSIQHWHLDANFCSQPTQNFVVDTVVHHAGTKALGYVGHDDSERRIVAAFKGTNGTIADIGTDLLVSLKSLTSFHHQCNIGGVSATTHQGFCNYHTSLNDGTAIGGLSLDSAIKAVAKKYPGYEVWFTGHSLGAAAASLQAVLFGHTTGIKSHLLTFGQPRVGDKTFADLVDKYTTYSTRVVHRRDPVPHLPPCCGGLTSAHCSQDLTCPRHHGSEVWYAAGMSSGDDNHMFCSSDEDPQCSNGITFDTHIKDHLVYFNNLGTCCGSAKSILNDDQQRLYV